MAWDLQQILPPEPLLPDNIWKVLTNLNQVLLHSHPGEKQLWPGSGHNLPLTGVVLML